MLITAPAIETDLLWGLSILFVGLTLLYCVSVFYFRNRISSKSLRTKQRKTELTPMISEFLFYEEDADKEEKSRYIGLKIEIRDLLKDDFNRKMLCEILLDLRKDVSGDTQKRLFKLYRDLGLEEDAFKKLQSWRWEVVSKGILELTQMQMEDAYGFIILFINDKRATIRKQAEIATVTLKPEGINYFLDTTKYKISEWQQLKLLDVLRNKGYFEPPRFKAWLTSTNRHVVLFALRLIKYYNQNDAYASLTELVKHRDEQVRKQAIECIKEFYVEAALPILKGVFRKSTIDIKIAILGAIAELGSTEDMEFLESVVQNESHFSVKSKAVGAINSIAPESIMPTKDIERIMPYEAPLCETNPDSPIDETDHEQAREGPDDSHDKHPVPLDARPEPATDKNPNQTPSDKYRPMANKKKSDEALRTIEIDIEEVRPVPYEEKQNTSDFNISEIHFLPVVVADEMDSKSGESPTNGGNEISADDLDNSEVPSTEISPEPMDDELEALVAEIKELAFLPLVTDVAVTSDQDVTIDAETEKSEQIDIEGYSLSDFEISFVEISEPPSSEDDENIGFNLDEEPIIGVNNPQLEDVMSWLPADNQLREIDCNYQTVPYSSDIEMAENLIPEPVYYDEHEAYMMKLLDDLEELGDHREIPLLEELRAEENKSFIKDRIAGMIDKFGRERNSLKPKKSNTDIEAADLPVFSVFADLFKSIDTESKLILLDEVIHVGDEKEIEFLDGLLEDPDPQIRNKAQIVLKLLITKLSHKNPSGTYSPRISAILAKQIKSDDNLSQQLYEGLLSEMDLAPAKDPEIFEIDFELCEVMDHNCDKKLWDLSVIATEVSPHESEGSFLSQLRNLTKLFF